MQRRLEAMRAIMEAPDRMTITRTESMVIITAQRRPHHAALTGQLEGQGRVHRLRAQDPLGRRPSGDEITGAGRGKVIETYAIDPRFAPARGIRAAGELQRRTATADLVAASTIRDGR